MTTWHATIVVLALLFASARAEDIPPPEVQAASDIANLFLEACFKHEGSPTDVRDWATARNLPEITKPADIKKVYAGDDGTAWLLRGKSTNAVLALRGQTDTCAVYGEHADPVAVARWFDMFVAGTVARLNVQEAKIPELDRDEPTKFGQHIGKIRLIIGEHQAVVLTLMTYEKPTSAYQVSMQMKLLKR